MKTEHVTSNFQNKQELSLQNTYRAFACKTDKNLDQTYALFKLLNNPALVKLLSNLTLWGLKLHLPIKQPIKKTIFRQFCGGESIADCQPVIDRLHQFRIGAILDYSVEGKEREKDFDEAAEEVMRIIRKAENDPAVPYTSIKMTGLARFKLLEKLTIHKRLTFSEKEEYKRVKKRLGAICKAAYDHNVPIYIDAEESWIQTAIDRLTEEMMQLYNHKKAIVSTTLQMYRWDRISYLNTLMTRARQQSFKIGVKLVRGAYWEKEQEREDKHGCISAVFPTKEETDHAFNQAIRICMENLDLVTLCVATHNEASTLLLIELMQQKKLPNDFENIYFSQLYGMSDHISYNLSAAGYNVTKYLPYGPVKSVIPYLIRRAEENTSISGQMSRELNYLEIEKRRRNLTLKQFL